jgi:hypothetical protein
MERVGRRKIGLGENRKSAAFAAPSISSLLHLTDA